MLNGIFKILQINIFLLSIITARYIAPGHQNYTLNNFSYGSCYRGFFSDRYDIFNTISLNNPQLWLWGGDSAYVHNVTFTAHDLFDEFYAKALYDATLAEEEYGGFEKKTDIIGIYDDHDFGANDSNQHFKFKDITKRLFLDFIREPQDSIRRTKNRGIYTSYSFGDKSSFKTVKLFLLDTRYNKTRFFFDGEQDMLGEEQWNWLEEEFSKTTETFIFIASGTQILAFDRWITEAWYKSSRKRLFELIGKYKLSGVTFITGDVHIAQLYRTFCIHPKIGYHLYEITSSGLSHFHFFALLFDDLLSNKFAITPVYENYNFADVNMIWGETKEDSFIRFFIRNIENKVVDELTLKWTDLKYSEKHSNDKKCENKLNSRFKDLEDYYSYYKKHWLEFLLVILFWLSIALFFLIFFKLFIVLKMVIFKLVRLFSLIKEKISLRRSKMEKNN